MSITLEKCHRNHNCFLKGNYQLFVLQCSHLYPENDIIIKSIQIRQRVLGLTFRILFARLGPMVKYELKLLAISGSVRMESFVLKFLY